MDKGIVNVVMDRSAYLRAAAAVERINPNSSPDQFEAAKVLCLMALVSARLAETEDRIHGGTQDPSGTHSNADQSGAIDINELKPLMGLDPNTKASEGARAIPLRGLAAWTHVVAGVKEKQPNGATIIYTNAVIKTPDGHILTLKDGKVVEAHMHTCVNPYCPICRGLPAHTVND